MALACLRVMLKLNGFQVIASQEAKARLVERIALKEISVQDVADWLKKHTRHL